ncbi:Protein of unknown function DUF594, partial [Dillenia turbinata]
MLFGRNGRRLVQVFPEPLRKVWNEWELRLLVPFSLVLQMSLIHLGSRRRYNTNNWIRMYLWSAYLMADWIATVALGVLTNDPGNNNNNNANASTNELSTFWAPFLLLHLGGPDTITAYALEDNELWLRHLLGLVVRTAVALYIFLTNWGSSWLSFLSIPMLVAGFVKDGEKTLALKSANTEEFRDSLLTAPDSGPNYAKFMEEFCLKKAEGFSVTTKHVEELLPIPIARLSPQNYSQNQYLDITDAEKFQWAYDLFQSFKRLFFHDRDKSRSFFQRLSPKDTFEVVEIELGFAYDVFYSKSPVIYTMWGLISRSVTISFTIIVFVLFVTAEKHDHWHLDLGVTYVLLIGAIMLEFYAVILIISSDWTDFWLSEHPKSMFHKFSYLRSPNKRRWCNSMAQLNLLSMCFAEKPMPCHRIMKFLHLDKVQEMLEMQRHKTYNKVSPELKALIFNHFWSKVSSKREPADLYMCRGNIVLEDNHCSNLVWGVQGEFDQSLLLWHIATDLCYHSDRGEEDSNYKASKLISDYLLYLLVMCPFMLPIGIGHSSRGQGFFWRKDSYIWEAQACSTLLGVSTEVEPKKVKGDRSKSVLFDACRLASMLQKMDREKMWEVVSQVWVAMLGFASCHCRGNYHAQQLRRGGELLTHVWFLMAHLGITKQLQISQGHARAKVEAAMPNKGHGTRIGLEASMPFNEER